jgi:hypothetical protein
MRCELFLQMRRRLLALLGGELISVGSITMDCESILHKGKRSCFWMRYTGSIRLSRCDRVPYDAAFFRLTIFQDVFLPFLEEGKIQLIGATTENPSFKLTGALLSRCRYIWHFRCTRLVSNVLVQGIRS